MEDGYYLSTYLHIDSLANLLKFRIRHDQNISLWKKHGNDVELVHYWELERITRMKQHNRSFYNIDEAIALIEKLLKPYNLTINDMVQIWGTPQLDTNETYNSINVYPDVSYHSITHLFSAILSDMDIFRNENIIGLALDGGPDTVIDQETYNRNFYAATVVNKGKIKEIFSTSSPGFLWSYLRRKCNLREGSLMALGSACKAQLKNISFNCPQLCDRTALHNAEQFVDDIYSYVNNLKIADEGVLFDNYDRRFSEEENKIAMLVKVIQEISMSIVEKEIVDILNKYNLAPAETVLSISGGYALNCPTNSYLVNKFHFKEFISAPCVNDSGISMGIALYAFYKELGSKMNFKLTSAFWGDSIKDLSQLSSSNVHYIKKTQNFDVEQVIEDIQREPIIWVEGRAEIGPRALGHRSILATVENNKSKEKLNIIKQRQWWRPVAPIILEDTINEWFQNAYSSPYMLHTFYVRDEKKSKIPAVLHLDGSARVQTINQCSHPLLYQVLYRYYQEKNIPMFCNTSLNDKGEPIINDLDRIIEFALEKNIHYVYVDGKRIYLEDASDYLPKTNNKQVDNDNFREKELKNLNPYAIEKEVLIWLYYRPELQKRFDLTKEEDVRRLKIYAKMAKIKMGIREIPGR